MRSPAITTLCDTFGLSRDGARRIKRIAAASRDGEQLRAIVDGECPATAQYVGRLYSDPYGSAMWRTTVALHAINVILGTHGVESLGPVDHLYGPPYEYLNAGDPYTSTLIYCRRTDSLTVGCWGDIAELTPDW